MILVAFRLSYEHQECSGRITLGSMMKKTGLARELAQVTRASSAAAKDQVEEAVHEILKALKRGRPVRLPGVGKLIPGARPKSR